MRCLFVFQIIAGQFLVRILNMLLFCRKKWYNKNYAKLQLNLLSGIITISVFFFFLFLGPPMEIIRKHLKHFSPVANNTFNELLLKEFDFLLIIYCLREKKTGCCGTSSKFGCKFSSSVKCFHTSFWLFFQQSIIKVLETVQMATSYALLIPVFFN